MAYVEIRDFVIWSKHIHGNTDLSDHVASLDQGSPIRLSVDDFEGVWVKMDNGKDGRSTPGIKPVGPAKKHLAELYKSKRGQLVEIRAL